MKDKSSLKESLDKALKEEIPALDEKLRNKVVEVTLKVIEKSAILQKTRTNSEELQSLIEPVIWKVAKVLEENLKKEMYNQHVELAQGIGSAIGSGNRELADEIIKEIDRAKDDIEKTIRDINWQNNRLY
jgi:hypothetical protein